MLTTSTPLSKGRKLIGAVVSKFETLVADIEAGIGHLEDTIKTNTAHIEQRLAENKVVQEELAAAQAVRDRIAAMFNVTNKEGE